MAKQANRSPMNTESDHPPSDDTSWFERPRTFNLIITLLCIVCVGLVLADLFYENPHPHFELKRPSVFKPGLDLSPSWRSSSWVGCCD